MSVDDTTDPASESPRPTQPNERPRRLAWMQFAWSDRWRIWLAGCAALTLHFLLFRSGTASQVTQAEFEMSDTPSMDVELLAPSAEEPAEAPAPAAPTPPEPEPPKPPEPVPPIPPVPEPPVPMEEKPEPTPEPKIEEKPDPMARTEPTPPPIKRTTPIARKRTEQASPRPAKSTAATSSTSTAKPPTTTGTASNSSSSGGSSTGTGSGKKGAGSTKPGYLVNPKPPYPNESRAAGESGTVTLHVSVNTSGRPQSVSISKSSGFSRLDRSALETVRSRWRFKPATRDGVAISSEVDIPIVFRR